MHLRFNFQLLLLFIALGANAQSAKQMTAEQYIAKFKDNAIKEMELFNIPASITLAQGMLESGNGNSDLATVANNHFGIKCHSGWTGATFTKDDDAKDECFRKYPTALDSYTDHSNFLRTRDRYAALFELKCTDYKGWAKGLKKVGYATDPKYTRRLIDLIEAYKLYQYDKENEHPPVYVKKEKDTKPVTASTSKVPVTKLEKTSKVTKPEPVERHISRSIQQFRFINYVTIQPGDSFEKIARETDKDVWQLCKYNDLKPTDKLIAGDRLYLQPKRRKGKEEFHVVKKGETMRSISQLYAIKLSSLYKKNRMNEGQEPRVGETLYLRQTKKDS
ncbi:MAG TPA: glucosaminidase domain-containing protein [Bacteroidia bacterium]|jgi:LysM repeat protein|nr:glucosaminidase domain-containing protein [Bacteroidia bacterium]HRG54124.1 glucosaminidase domain-containing protein [Bacteroidia bacterium]